MTNEKSVTKLLRRTLRFAQESFAQRSLKSDLSKLVYMAKDHEANGLAAGHGYYQLLYKTACDKAEAYAKLRGVDSKQIYAELASLEVLRRLAEGLPVRPAVNVMAILLAAIAGPVIIGFGSGMVQVAFRWALHIFGVH
jgi:hypothetical protein